MRKPIYLLLLVFIVINSCKKSDNSIINNDEVVNEIAISHVINTENEDLQRIQYRSLSSSEKVAVWKYKYTKLLANTNLTQSQKSFILLLRKLVTSEAFNNKSKVLGNLDKKELKETAISLFGVSGAYFVLASINEEKRIEISVSTLSLNSTSGPNSCRCSRSDDWCSYPTTCIGINCSMTVEGCGWWWEEDCNGTCVDRTWH